MKTEKKIHPLWKHSNIAAEEIYHIIDKYQYIYSSDKGMISLIYLRYLPIDLFDRWEIYCLKGNLFNDIERYPTKKAATQRARDLLR